MADAPRPFLLMLDDSDAARALLERLRAGDGTGVAVVVAAAGERLVATLCPGGEPPEAALPDVATVRVQGLDDALVDANRRLAEQALTDDLTGLANRRHGAHELERAVALATRHGHELALAQVDVDGFKRVNDAFGHQAGDDVLAEVARRLASAVRGGDELARWGGDEFVVILPDTDRAGAARAAERLRAAVAAAPIAGLEVTVSVGWAHWTGEAPDDLLAGADRALYRAKDAGRNAVFPPG